MDSATEDSRGSWSTLQRIGFRVAFVYLGLYVLVVLGNLGSIGSYESLWRKIAPWVGKHVLHLPNDITIFTNGSGDKTYDWVRAYSTLVLAVVAAIIWSVFDWKRANYARLDQWLRVAIRFSVMPTMIFYGGSKVIPTQFSSPSLDRLLQPFGDASPMGLLWTFMGASVAYNIFTGIAEMASGVFMIARRTTTLGALLCVGVMSNVFMMNMSYDVPVKLLSFHIVLMSIYLLLPDLERLANVLLLNRPAPRADLRPLFEQEWLNWGALAVRTVFTVWVLVGSLVNARDAQRQFGDLAPRSPLFGVWLVSEFEANGAVRMPLTTDAFRWRRVVFDRPTFLSIYGMNDTRQRYLSALDLEKKALTLTKGQDKNWRAQFSLNQAAPDQILLEGTFEGKRIKAKLQRDDTRKFLLTTRGFHWINEFPFNR